ncbi:MAG: SpoIVB peptidase [Clostridia bacterium]|nr:SpoIVB peptidase [Clostridia bacterium]
MQHTKKISCFLILLLLFSSFFAFSAAAQQVIPGGDAVAVRLQSDGVILLGFTDESKDNPARKAGLKRGDRITKIGESEIHSDDDLIAALNLTAERTTLCYVRGKKECQTAITPRRGEDGEPQLGILIKDSTAGIGTLTFVLPDCGGYGCLGHGITDPDTEALFCACRGDLYPARITSVRKGLAGAPGELQGMFGAPLLGSAVKNTETGLFGTLDAEALSQREWVELGNKNEVREGAATIRCTLDEGGIQEYTIEIVRIYRVFGGTTKNMLLKVTDEALLAKTGGIVQGMSGSPIFQNGKLVGAVTHVLVNDPTSGYGIFIENMLDNAAQMPMAKAS